MNTLSQHLSSRSPLQICHFLGANFPEPVEMLRKATPGGSLPHQSTQRQVRRKGKGWPDAVRAGGACQPASVKTWNVFVMEKFVLHTMLETTAHGKGSLLLASLQKIIQKVNSWRRKIWSAIQVMGPRPKGLWQGLGPEAHTPKSSHFPSGVDLYLQLQS